MEKFLEQYQSDVTGVLHGFDRIILKGHLKDFYHNNGFYYYLSQENVKLKEFKTHAEKVTTQLKAHVEALAIKAGAYTEYLNSSSTSKEGIAKRIIKERSIQEGLVCILSAVEPCRAITVRLNKNTGKLEKHLGNRKCLHYYFYYLDRDFGLMYIRLQTWLPFGVQLYVNGREYLKRQLDQLGIRYESYDNSITWVEDVEQAQKISDKFHEKKWHKVFDRFAERVNGFLPRIKEIFNSQGYEWFVEQCEYATDIMFKDRERLERLYPYFIEYASLCQMGENIFTFFGRKVHGHYQGEAVSDRKHFWGQGFRVKFILDKNSIKMYDKSTILRIETTINNANAFKVENPQTKKGWSFMGKAISNLYRYAEVSKKCNERYLESLANINNDINQDEAIESLSKSREVKLSERSEKPRKYSGFNLLANATTQVFNALLSGEFSIAGFRNRDLRDKLKALNWFSAHNSLDSKKIAGKVTRLIAKLRAHGVIQKVENSFRYKVTPSAETLLARIMMMKKWEMKSC